MVLTVKTIEHERRDRIIVAIILLIGFLCVIVAGRWALSFPPNWELNADMESNLDPNSDFLTRRPSDFIEAVDPSILTPPVWINLFLTPGAQFATRTLIPVTEGTSFRTPTAAAKPTQTQTPFETSTPTSIASATNTNVITVSPTNTLVYYLPTSSSTSQPKPTATPTFPYISTPTSAVTTTQTVTPTTTQISTATPITPYTSTLTPPVTATQTVTPTQISIATPTAPYTSTPTPAVIDTQTLMPTAIQISTATSTPTPTDTPTSTPTNTPTPTATNTPTDTPTATTPPGCGATITIIGTSGSYAKPSGSACFEYTDLTLANGGIFQITSAGVNGKVDGGICEGSGGIPISDGSTVNYGVEQSGGVMVFRITGTAGTVDINVSDWTTHPTCP